MKYDTLYVNGRIFTSDREHPLAQAMAVKDGRIAWIGTDEEAERLRAEASEVVDFCAKRILPGFVDCHMHAIMLADFAKQISVLPPAIYSIEDLVQAIRKARGNQEAGQWIQGWGYDEGKLAEGRAPNRYDLDRGCSDSPVLVQRTCTHICAVNSCLLQLAGITKDTPDPEGGKIGRDEKGEPDGILYENATRLVLRLIPEKTDEDLAEDLADLGKILVSQGVTTASDLGETVDPRLGHIFEAAIRKGFRNRTAAYVGWYQIEQHGEEILAESPYFKANGQFRISGIKLLGDGSVSGRTAWCDQPYLPAEGGCREPEYGMPVVTEKEIMDAMAVCKKYKCQLSVHAMGARAIDRVVNLTWKEKPWMENPEIPSVRMEHIAMPSRQAMQRAATAGIAWVTQPVFLYSEIESYEKNLQPERIYENYPLADWQELGIRFALSTDSPATSWATPSEPFANLKGAVTRKAWNGHECGQRHRLDISTAVERYTREGASILGFTDVGMLKEGFAADFIALDRDVLEIPADEIDQVKVDGTWIGGEKVFERTK